MIKREFLPKPNCCKNCENICSLTTCPHDIPHKKARIWIRIKRSAHKAVLYATKKGILIRPKNCTNCYKSDKKIEGHHPNYKEKLKVEWLCTDCHANINKKIVNYYQWN